MLKAPASETGVSRQFHHQAISRSRDREVADLGIDPNRQAYETRPSTCPSAKSVRRAGLEPALPEGACFTDRLANPRRPTHSVLPEGFEPPEAGSVNRCPSNRASRASQPAPPAGFEPAASTVTGWRALRCSMRAYQRLPRAEPSGVEGNRTPPVCLQGSLASLGTCDPSFQQSAQWESNPRFRHGKTAGCRCIMGAIQSEEWESNPHAPVPETGGLPSSLSSDRECE